MKYKGIEILKIFPIVYLGDEFKNKSFKYNEEYFKEKTKNLNFKYKFSYECPIEKYYDNYEETLAECELLNDTKILGDNEKYIVVEVEE